MTPHATPQALIAIDRPTRTATQPRTSTDPRDPEGHEEQGERREVVAEAVAELDPALAEMHQVDEGDRDDCNRGAGDQAGPRKSQQRRDRQQISGAGQQQAHPDRVRDDVGHVVLKIPRASPGWQAGRTSGRRPSMIARFWGT